jgi:hypothetical protein
VTCLVSIFAHDNGGNVSMTGMLICVPSHQFRMRMRSTLLCSELMNALACCQAYFWKTHIKVAEIVKHVVCMTNKKSAYNFGWITAGERPL